MINQPVALLFDTFGTVVDWRGSIIAAGDEVSRRRGIEVDWGTFANEWRTDGYIRPIMEMFAGKREWAPVDRCLGDQFDLLLERYGLGGLADNDRRDLLTVWRRLRPWPDAVEGLIRLKTRYLIGPLSNGGFALLAEMAKASGLPWDFVISAESFRAYKPSPSVYLGALRLLERAPDEVMLVAAHPADLDAAGTVGMQTGYVPRPLEWGAGSTPPSPGQNLDRFTIVAEDFTDLAARLGV